jgi:hypothetical protein
VLGFRAEAVALANIRNVQIATHSRCNANCIFCPYVESWHAEQPGVMSDAVWHRILTELSGPRFFAGVNGGKVCPYLMQEPLLDPRIIDRIEDIFATFPETTVELATNGAALSKRLTDSLIPLLSRPGRMADIWISHHGIDAESLRRVMQIDHAKALRNIVYFVDAASAALDPGRCRIVLRGAGFDFSRRQRFYTADEYRAYWATQLPHANPDMVFYDYFGVHDRAGTITRTERDANTLNYGVVRQIDPEHPFHCARLDEWVHFMFDGAIVLCCMDYHREVRLPSIMDVSLAEYFESDAYRAISRAVTGEISSPPTFICKRCSQPTSPGAGRWAPYSP